MSSLTNDPATFFQVWLSQSDIWRACHRSGNSLM